MLTQTIIVERGVRPKSPLVLEGFPGLGSVAYLSTVFLIKELKAKKIAELYSPHFPHHALADAKGLVRLPRGEIYRSPATRRKPELVIINGDAQPQTSYGQYDVADHIVTYAVKCNAKRLISLGGFASPRRGPSVVGAATNPRLVREMAKAGVSVRHAGIPVVGIAGLIIAIARQMRLEAMCLLSRTDGVGPDPAAAKRLLESLGRLLGVRLDVAKLDRQVERTRRLEKKLADIERTLLHTIANEREERKTIYIG